MQSFATPAIKVPTATEACIIPLYYFFFFTHCDLWDVLFSLVRHVFPLPFLFFLELRSAKIVPLCADAVAALAWMGASGNGRPSVSVM